MKLQVRISRERMYNAISEGIELQSKMLIDVDIEKLTPEQREILSRNVKLSSDQTLYFSLASYVNSDGKYEFHEFSSEKIELIISEMKELEIKRLEVIKLEKEKEEDMKVSTLEIDKILSSFTSPYLVKRSADFSRLEFRTGESPIRVIEFVIPNGGHKNYKAMLDFVKSDNFKIEFDKAIAKFKKEDEIKIADQEKKHIQDTKKKELKAWALSNGSELLRARIDENLNWFQLANEEWFASVCPDGFTKHDDDEYDSCWEYNNPTMEHINELRKAKENTLFSYVGLQKCRKDDDGDRTFYYFVEAQFKAFNGIDIYTVSKVIDTETEEYEN